MAKRFTDTNKYKKPFIRGLQGAYKLLWDYLYHDCDHAGIWIVDFEIAQLYIGSDMPINKSDALKYFNLKEERIIEFDEGKKWFIKPFIDFQYGILNPENRVHKSIILELEKYNLNKTLISSLKGAKDKDKDKDMVKDKDEYKEQRVDFNEFRKQYPGTKSGNEVEFTNFIKKHRDWKDVLPILIDRLNYQKESFDVRRQNKLFVPSWRNLDTWINQRGWEDQINTEE
jgi:hypothetical protein